MRSILLLAHLNDVDLSVDALRARLLEIAQALKEPTALLAARKALVLAETELAQALAVQDQREVTRDRAAEKLAQAEAKLYGGKVRDSRELADAERDVGQLRRQREHAEDELLEALLAVEAATETCDTRRVEAAQLAEAWQAAQLELTAERSQLTRRLAAEQERQLAARRAAPAELLPLYDVLRVRKGGRAVSRLEGEMCGTCRVDAPPTVVEAACFGDALVYCENCGRLLCGE